jgi:hypothetical protein
MLMLVMLDLVLTVKQAAKSFAERHGWEYVVCVG